MIRLRPVAVEEGRAKRCEFDGPTSDEGPHLRRPCGKCNGIRSGRLELPGRGHG